MRQLASKYGLVIFFSIIMSACASGKLNYRLDPEITGMQKLSSVVSLVSIKVTDNRKNTQNDNNPTIVSGPADVSKVLTSNLMDNFKRNNFKIINNELLADLALDFQIEELSAGLTEGLFQSTISAKSKIRLHANKKSRTFEKIFTNSLEQEVANPVNELDITGVMNQLLSKQLSGIIEDPAIIKLAKE